MDDQINNPSTVPTPVPAIPPIQVPPTPQVQTPQAASTPPSSSKKMILIIVSILGFGITVIVLFVINYFSIISLPIIKNSPKNVVMHNNYTYPCPIKINPCPTPKISTHAGMPIAIYLVPVDTEFLSVAQGFLLVGTATRSAQIASIRDIRNGITIAYIFNGSLDPQIIKEASKSARLSIGSYRIDSIQLGATIGTVGALKSFRNSTLTIHAIDKYLKVLQIVPNSDGTFQVIP